MALGGVTACPPQGGAVAENRVRRQLGIGEGGWFMQQSEERRGEVIISRAGSECPTGDRALPWVVTDAAARPVEPVSEFLRDFVACGNSAASCRSYGYDLLRWWRFLDAVDVAWDHAQRGEVRDFIVWLRTAHNPRAGPSPIGPIAGGVGESPHRQAVPVARPVCRVVGG
jgi:hypothetical protein